jgi:outer membrane protein OmpA-like peptidoglycan-associated protein
MGANWLAETTVTYPAFPATSAEFEYDTGWAMVGALGFKGNNLRIEFELGYRDNQSDTVTTTPPAATTLFSDVTYFSQMVNVVWDIPLGETVEFSIGGGAGGAQVDYDLGGTFGGLQSIDDGEYVFAYQGIAGLSVDVSDHVEIFAEYRYFDTDEFHVQGSPPPAGGESVIADPESHTALFGVRYHFFADQEVAQPLEPAAPPPPPPAAVPKTYIIFFDFNKSSLNADAQGVISEAADAYKSTGSTHVLIVGHTDTVGARNYNKRLSERRAAVVKDEMVRLGVPDEAIATEGRGFDDLLVPTGPGTREPRNRRAVIELQGAQPSS